MKYFTPELLAKYGAHDEKVADAAHVEWEGATEKYQNDFRAIQSQLPKKFRALLQRYYFHDARVCFVGIEDQVFHLTLQLDAPPRETLFLRYRIVSEVKMVSHVMVGHDNSQPLTWLYDEVDIASEGVFPVIEHRILLSNGLELAIQFQELSYSSAKTLPLIAHGVAGAVRIEMAGSV
jgi:hypothetical protein